MKKALIFGILGQDGSYMAELLGRQGYKVYGLVKKGTDTSRVLWLQNLVQDLTIIATDILEKKNMESLMTNIHPDEIYNFAGVSNVFNPWENSEENFNLNARLPSRILEFISKFDKNIKYFQASSCLIFGRNADGIQNEMTPFAPILPYGVAKLMADGCVKEYRNNFDIFCCSGIFYNHESPRRGDEFFTKKISNMAKKIKHGNETKFSIGNLNDSRDYGYAPDFMEAVFSMMQDSAPEDYVIGTGQLTTNEEFIKKCFERVDLNYQDHIEIDPSLTRKYKVETLKADITKIKKNLNWQPKHSIDDIVSIMMTI